jgi:hypothetical protein
VGLSTEEILCTYTCRWPIEVYFKQSKNTLAFGGCQIRSKTGIERYWLILSLVHDLCCTSGEVVGSLSQVTGIFSRKSEAVKILVSLERKTF